MRILLHIIAALTAAAVVWYVRMLLADDVKLEILCLPFLAIWFFYYTLCLFWSGNQPLPPIIAP